MFHFSLKYSKDPTKRLFSSLTFWGCRSKGPGRRKHPILVRNGKKESHMVSCYCRQLLNHLTYSRLCPTLSNYVCRSEDSTLKAMPELVQEYHQNGLRLNSVTLISYLHQWRHKIPIGRKTRGEKKPTCRSLSETQASPEYKNILFSSE